MPPYALPVTSLKKRLGSNLPLVWLKTIKMIASFTTRTMAKTTPEIGVVCGGYQFSRFYVK
jgi:hypothetical protein